MQVMERERRKVKWKRYVIHGSCFYVGLCSDSPKAQHRDSYTSMTEHQATHQRRCVLPKWHRVKLPLDESTCGYGPGFKRLLDNLGFLGLIGFIGLWVYRVWVYRV